MYEGYQQQQMAANPMGTAPPAPEEPLAQAATEAKNASLSSPYVDPGAQGTLRGGLEAQRQGDSNYSTVLPALAQALPMVALGPVAGAASLGLSGAAEHLNLPGPIQTAAGLAPYFMGGVGDLPTQTAFGGGPLGATLTGSTAESLPTALTRTAGAGALGYVGTEGDKALGLPTLPVVGGPLGMLGLGLGSALPEAGTALRAGAENLATSGLTPRPIAPEAVGLRDPAASGMQEVLSGNGGGKAPPPGPRDPYNLFDAVGAEKAAARVPDAVYGPNGELLQGVHDVHPGGQITLPPTEFNPSAGPNLTQEQYSRIYSEQAGNANFDPSTLGERAYTDQSGRLIDAQPGKFIPPAGLGNPLEGLIRAPNEPTIPPADPIAAARSAAEQDAARGYRTNLSLGPDDINNPVVQAYKAQVAGLPVGSPVPPNVQSGQIQPPAQNVQQNVPRPLAPNETGSVGGGTYGKATQPDIPPTPGADLADLLSRAKGMAPNDLRAEAIRLGVPIEGRMPPNSLIGRIADAREAALAAAGQRVVDLPALAKKLPETTLTDLRVGDPQAIAESALQKATDKRDALKANPSPSTQVQLRAASHEVSMVQRAIDTHFPDSPMATAERTPAQGVAPAPGAVAPSVNPSAAPSISEMINSGMTSAEATRTFQDRAAQAGGEAVDRIQSGQQAARVEPVFNPDGTPSELTNAAGPPQRTLEAPSYTDAGKAQRAGEALPPTRAQTFSDAQTALYDSINRKVSQTEQGLGRSLTDTERLRIAESERAASGIKPPEITASFLDYANLPRSMMAGADMSYALRQMALLVPTHFPEAIKSLGQGVRSVLDPEHAALIEDQIKNSSFASLKESNRFGKLYQAPMGDTGSLLTREENYGSLPALNTLGPVGKLVRGIYEPLERGNTTMINKFRSDVADNFINTTLRNNGADGLSGVTPKMAKDIGTYNNFINRATGRGNLGSVEKAALPLGQVFFSLRSAIAKPQAAGYLLSQPGSPVWNQVAKDFAGFLGTGVATLALADQAGLKVGLDPRSSDFGKIRVGDTHIDLWAGWQPMVRAIYQEAQGVHGENNRVTSSGAGYHVGALPLAGDFIRNKLSPQAGAALDLAGPSVGIDRPRYRDAPGFNVKTGINYLAPLWIQSAADALKHDGVQGAALAGGLDFFGGGTQSYAPQKGEVRGDVLSGGKAALPSTIDQKNIPAFDLLPKERTAVDKVAQAARPDVYQNAQDSRTDPQKAHDTILQQAATIQNAQLTSLQDDLFNGVKDPVQAEQERKQINADAKWRRDNAPPVPYDGPETEKGPANQLLSGYYNISKNVPPGLDGKPNYDGIKQAQSAYMSALAKDYPQLAERIANQLNGPAETVHQLNKVHDEAQPLMDKYFGEITNPKTRTAERIAHPEEDAQLVLLGIEHEPASIAAARLLQQWAPNLHLAAR